MASKAGQEIVTRRAPVQVTGGAGFRYENSVAARFLLDLLGGANALGVDFGRITRIDWQARDSGWLADDLVIACRTSGGDRTAAVPSVPMIVRHRSPEEFSLGAQDESRGYAKGDAKLDDAAGVGAAEGRRPTAVPTPAAATPELSDRPRRRTFSVQDKLRVLAEIDRAAAAGPARSCAGKVCTRRP